MRRTLPAVIDCVQKIMLKAATSGFQTTRWTLIKAAACNSTPDSRDALATLCQAYWFPVYAFIRRKGHDPETAQDLTQGFFTLLMEKNYLLDVDRQRGRFRSFLLTAVKHFLANEWDRRHAQKRGGGREPISIDAVEAESWYIPAIVDEATPETLFQRRWALSLLEHVMAKLRAEFALAGKADRFEKLSVFLNQDSGETRCKEVADEMGLSEGALRTSIHRLRRTYRRLLREEIAQTVSTPEETDEEIRFLMSTLTS